MVGNPPYIRIQTLKKEDPELADYYKKRFPSASKGNYDLYVCFVERGMELLHIEGQLAYIVPHKFFNAQYGLPLRQLISQSQQLRHIVHFGDQQIFPGATNYVCLLFLAKAGVNTFRFVKSNDILEWQRTFKGEEKVFSASEASKDEWNFGVGNKGAIRKNGVWTPLPCKPVEISIIPRPLYDRIDLALSWVLNPLSHSESIDRYRDELFDAADCLRDLRIHFGRIESLGLPRYLALMRERDKLVRLLKFRAANGDA